MRDLFRGYNKLVRPVQNMSMEVEVKFGLTFTQLISVVSPPFFLIVVEAFEAPPRFRKSMEPTKNLERKPLPRVATKQSIRVTTAMELHCDRLLHLVKSNETTTTPSICCRATQHRSPESVALVTVSGCVVLCGPILFFSSLFFHPRCCSISLIFAHFRSFQNEKNQVMKSNVWLRLVRDASSSIHSIH